MQFSTSIISFLFPCRFSTLNSGTSRVQLQQSEFCDDAPCAIPMTINNGNNMPDIHQNGVDGQLPEYENYYQNGNIYVYVFMYII